MAKLVWHTYLKATNDSYLVFDRFLTSIKITLIKITSEMNKKKLLDMRYNTHGVMQRK